jgi:predicted transposase/invertase (TIGR01784 family)
MRHDQDNEQLSDAIHVIYVELSKLDETLKKSVNDMTDLEKWAVFFQYADEPACRQTLNRIIETKEALQMAGDLLMTVSQDERERAVLRSRRMFQTDMQSDMATSEDIGKEFVARNALAEGLPVDLVSKITGFDIETIKRLQG